MESNEKLNQLEMAKKRNHKIAITDEAISKVPYVRYREIPETEYANLQRLAKDVLTISKEQNDSNEVALIYSLESKLLIAKGRQYMGISLGDEHSVNPMENPISSYLIRTSLNCAVVCLHNHPSLSNISLEDVKFFLNKESIKLLIAITNLGNISYIVKSKKFDWNKAVDLYNEAVDIHNLSEDLKGYQKAAKYFLKNCSTAGIIFET